MRLRSKHRRRASRTPIAERIHGCAGAKRVSSYELRSPVLSTNGVWKTFCGCRPRQITATKNVLYVPKKPRTAEACEIDLYYPVAERVFQRLTVLIETRYDENGDIVTPENTAPSAHWRTCAQFKSPRPLIGFIPRRGYARNRVCACIRTHIYADVIYYYYAVAAFSRVSISLAYYHRD